MPRALQLAEMKRPLWMAAGLAFTGIGAIGAFLPLLPTVPLLLLAAFCFARGNPAFEQRLLDHPRWGPPMREWRERRAISRKGKISALTAMAFGALVTWLTLGLPWALGVAAILCVTGTWIWTRAE